MIRENRIILGAVAFLAGLVLIFSCVRDAEATAQLSDARCGSIRNQNIIEISGWGVPCSTARKVARRWDYAGSGVRQCVWKVGNRSCAFRVNGKRWYCRWYGVLVVCHRGYPRPRVLPTTTVDFRINYHD